jgi:hypothetical protein
MKSVLLLSILTILIVRGNGFLNEKKPTTATSDDHRVLANVKIYSNLAEIVQPLGKLPLEFSADDWSDIRSDSVTLVGSNVNVTQQTITEKKKSLNNARVYVRSPSSSNTETKFLKATLIDEKRNLVKLIDKAISTEPIFLTVSSDHIVYDDQPPQSKYYVNFTYETTDAVHVSYLRSNLNWKTRYQLNLLDEPKNPVLVAMADIRNDGQSKVDIEHAELLAGDINLQMYERKYIAEANYGYAQMAFSGQRGPPSASLSAIQPSVGQGEEVSGLYIFAINQPFSIDAKTNYLLPMFRPQVTVERYGSISKYFYGNAGSSTGKAQRSYRLSSDRFLSLGNCIIRESDRLVGETSLPDLAAKNRHEFSIGQDADIVYKENITLIASYTYNTTTSSSGRIRSQTRSIYDISLLLKNFKKNRSVKIEYEQGIIHGNSMKLLTSITDFTQESLKIKYKTTIAANDEKLLSYRIEIIN